MNHNDHGTYRHTEDETPRGYFRGWVDGIVTGSLLLLGGSALAIAAYLLWTGKFTL